MEAIAARKFSPNKLSELVVVGKDVLELLSSAMYVDPLCIYREYIQNAADAIDEAEVGGLYSKAVTPKIRVSIDANGRTIRIEDNGVGVSPNVFSRRLTALGASKKRGSNARGFRGVGRLCGLAYCQDLIFRSKSLSGQRVWEVRFDCRRLKELLNDREFRGDVNDVMYEIVEFDTRDDTRSRAHFFEVEMRKVSRVGNDLLLNEAVVRNYLSQVAPAPFRRGFSFAGRITKHLSKYAAGKTYNIYLNGDTSRVERPFTNRFPAKQRQDDNFLEFEAVEIPGLNGGIDAAGWILHHNYHGALPENLGLRGLRLRLGNMQIGGDDVFEAAFPEPRFNSWSVGEIHVLSSRLSPNGRRDDLEQNVHQQNLLNHVTALAKRIAKLCRKKSAERHRAKKPLRTAISTLTLAQQRKLLRCRPKIAATIDKILSVLARTSFRKNTLVIDALLAAGAKQSRRR